MSCSPVVSPYLIHFSLWGSDRLVIFHLFHSSILPPPPPPTLSVDLSPSPSLLFPVSRSVCSSDAAASWWVWRLLHIKGAAQEESSSLFQLPASSVHQLYIFKSQGLGCCGGACRVNTIMLSSRFWKSEWSPLIVVCQSNFILVFKCIFSVNTCSTLTP